MPIDPAKLRQLRTDAGLSQQALAERAGVRQATLSEIETGRTAAAEIQLRTIEGLARALGVTLAELQTPVQ